MIDGAVVAAYLALAIKGEFQATVEIADALHRLRDCVVQEIGPRPFALLEADPTPWRIRAFGAELDVALAMNSGFARSLGEIVAELERGGADSLIADVRLSWPPPASGGAEQRWNPGQALAQGPASPSAGFPAGYPGPAGSAGGRDGPPSLWPRFSRKRPKDPVDTASPTEVMIESAVRDVVTEGRVLFNPPDKMRQGRRERVEVAIAKTKDLDEELRKMVRGRGEVRLSDIETSPFMKVELKGPGFDIALVHGEGGAEQLLRPTALWEFDVVPRRTGQQVLQVCASMRIPLRDRPDERVSVPVLEREIRVTIDPRYSTSQFVGQNWKWLVATGVGFGGALTAWLKLFGGE